MWWQWAYSRVLRFHYFYIRFNTLIDAILVCCVCVCVQRAFHLLCLHYTIRNASMHSFNIFFSMSTISWWTGTVCIVCSVFRFEMFLIPSSEQIFRSFHLFELRLSFTVHRLRYLKHMRAPLSHSLDLVASLSACPLTMLSWYWWCRYFFQCQSFIFFRRIQFFSYAHFCSF